MCNIFVIIISTNKKAGDNYQANTGTQKERHPYYNTGEKVKQYEKSNFRKHDHKIKRNEWI